MTNGITWEEETRLRLDEARDKQMQEESKLLQAQSAIQFWAQYANALEKMLELDKEKPGVSSNGNHLNTEGMRKQSTWNNLVAIMNTNNGLLVAVDATTILVEAGVFQEREHARNVIYSTLYSHKKDVEKIREGVYRLHKRSDTNKNTAKESRTNTKKQRTISGVRQVVKDLKELNPQMTQKQVLDYLLNKGFDFKGKNPGNAVNMAWVRLGYSKEGKQQSLPGVT